MIPTSIVLSAIKKVFDFPNHKNIIQYGKVGGQKTIEKSVVFCICIFSLSFIYYGFICISYDNSRYEKVIHINGHADGFRLPALPIGKYGFDPRHVHKLNKQV